MENLFVSALLWTNIIQTDPGEARRPVPTVRITSEIQVTQNPRQKSLKKFQKRLLYDRIKKQVEKVDRPTTLVFAPHPDDAILCCSLEIRKRIKNNESVKIIYVTSGDAKEVDGHDASKKYGRTRSKEAQAATKQLGLNTTDLIFLNYPDGYLALLDDVEIMTSQYTGQTQTNKQAQSPNLDYTWLNLRKSIKDIIDTHKPKEIFIPNQYIDKHWDHREVGRVAQFILAEMENPPKTFMYAIHRKYPLKKGSVNQFKLSLINIFRSQFHDEKHRTFLENFAQYPEIFRIWEKE